jgi:hypothetical protein
MDIFTSFNCDSDPVVFKPYRKLFFLTFQSLLSKFSFSASLRSVKMLLVQLQYALTKPNNFFKQKSIRYMVSSRLTRPIERDDYEEFIGSFSDVHVHVFVWM